MAYSETGDLLLGDMLLGGLDPQKYVDDAARDMDAKLGWLYKLPLREKDKTPGPESWKQLPQHEVLTLRQINNKLASGKLILAMAVGQEGTAVHAYGLHLVQEGTAELLLLANGTIDLGAVKLDGTAAGSPVDSGSRTPAMKVHDTESLLDGFENTVMRQKPWFTRPGEVA